MSSPASHSSRLCSAWPSVRIAVATEFGSALGWWKRLQDEGHDVSVWIATKNLRFVGDGIVPKSGSWDTLKQWATLGMKAGIPTIVFFDSSGLGDKAEEAREAGLAVVGGGKFPDKLEKDRLFGFRIAEEAGMALPEYEYFDSIESCLKRARKIEDANVYFKSNRYMESDATHGTSDRDELVEYLEYVIRKHGGHGTCILQSKVEGVDISTARWWNGKTWVGPYEGTVEHKPFMNGDVGPATGCAINTVWMYEKEEDCPLHEVFRNLEYPFRKYNAPPGLYDINGIVSPEGKMYFLEWTPRLGYDSELTSFRLTHSLGHLLASVAFGKDEPRFSSDVAYGLRVSISPYPWEYSKKVDTKTCIGTYVSGEVGDLWSEGFIAAQLRYEKGILEVASPEGFVGITYGQAKTLSRAVAKAEEAAKGIRCPGLAYRTDGAKTLQKHLKDIQDSGVRIPEGLVH